MPRGRRRWWMVAAVVVLAAAAVIVSASVTTSPTAPLHFWVRMDETTHRLFDAPDGREIGGWTAVAPRFATMKPEGLEVVETIDVVRRTLARAGLVKVSERSLLVQFARASDSPAPDAAAAWRECFAAIADWPDDAIVDPALVGEWDEIGAHSSSIHSLRADGEVVRAWVRSHRYRWGRVGDILVFGLVDGSVVGWPPPADWAPVEIAVLAPDGQSFRTAGGQVISKIRR